MKGWTVTSLIQNAIMLERSIAGITKRHLLPNFAMPLSYTVAVKNPNFCLVRHREVNIQLTSTKYLGPNSFRTAMLRFLNAIGSAIMDSEHGGTPEAAYDRCVSSWKKVVPAKMPIVPIIGQVLKVKATDIARYQHIIDLHRLTELHFYTFEEGISQDRLDEWRFLGQNTPMALVDAIQPTHPSPPLK